MDFYIIIISAVTIIIATMGECGSIPFLRGVPPPLPVLPLPFLWVLVAARGGGEHFRRLLAAVAPRPPHPRPRRSAVSGVILGGGVTQAAPGAVPRGWRYAEEICGARPRRSPPERHRRGRGWLPGGPRHLVPEQPGVGGARFAPLGSSPSAGRLRGRAEEVRAGPGGGGEPPAGAGPARPGPARPGALTPAGFPQQRPHGPLLRGGCFSSSLGLGFDPLPCRGDIDCTSYLLIKGVTYIIIL